MPICIFISLSTLHIKFVVIYLQEHTYSLISSPFNIAPFDNHSTKLFSYHIQSARMSHLSFYPPEALLHCQQCHLALHHQQTCPLSGIISTDLDAIPQSYAPKQKITYFLAVFSLLTNSYSPRHHLQSCVLILFSDLV